MRGFPRSLVCLVLIGLLCALLGACSSQASPAHRADSSSLKATATPALDVPVNTWAQLNTPGKVTDLAVSPANTAVVFACVSMAGGKIAVYRSDNRGASWQQLQVPGASGNCVLSVDPTTSQHVYLALGQMGSMALYKSTDEGTSWSESLASGTAFADGQIQFVDNGLETLVYTPTASEPNLVRLERSTDGGKTWAPIDQPLLDQGVVVLSMISDPLNAATMLALTQVNPAQDYTAEALRGGLWESSDAGKTWSEVSSNVPLNGELLAGADGQNIYAYDPGVPVLEVSQDGGQNWLTLSLPAAATAPGAGPLSAAQLAAGNQGAIYLVVNQHLYVYSPQHNAWQLMPGAPAFSGSGPVFFTGGEPGTLWLSATASTLDRYIPGS